jgi:hypothetical protein
MRAYSPTLLIPVPCTVSASRVGAEIGTAVERVFEQSTCRTHQRESNRNAPKTQRFGGSWGVLHASRYCNPSHYCEKVCVHTLNPDKATVLASMSARRG